MAEILDVVLKVSLVIFMAGNLLGMGLLVDLSTAGQAMRDARFVGYSLLWGFVACPALAWLLGNILPLAPAHALGLILLGMTPCAPFLPMVVNKAGGDMNYAAAFMLLMAVGTVVFMPFAVPLMTKGMTADPWTIAMPLLYFVAVPLAIGMGVKTTAAPVASRLHPFVKGGTDIATLVMLFVFVLLYGKGLIGLIGTYAIAAQILFCVIAAAAAYGLSLGLPQRQRSVLALGVCTRNIWAAIAPLFAIPDADAQAQVMVALAVIITVLLSFPAARWFGRRAAAGEPRVAQATGQTEGPRA